MTHKIYDYCYKCQRPSEIYEDEDGLVEGILYYCEECERKTCPRCMEKCKPCKSLMCYPCFAEHEEKFHPVLEGNP